MVCRIDTDKFRLQHGHPDLFHRSVWDGSGAPSLWYTIYRVTLALFMLTGILLHFVSTLDTLGTKWFIYMTNQGILLLTVHYLVYAGVVVGRRLGAPHPLGGLPTLYSVSWGLQSCFTTVALWITVVYWTALHPYVVKCGLMSGLWMETLNYFLHLVNTLSCLLDMFMTARPVRIHHFYLAVLFGVWYTLFSATYWAAGGIGACRPRIADWANATEPCPQPDPCADFQTTNANNCTVVCDSYIYPILDWGDKPGEAVAIVLGGCVVMPLMQGLWWAIAKLRDKLGAKAASRE